MDSTRSGAQGAQRRSAVRNEPKVKWSAATTCRECTTELTVGFLPAKRGSGTRLKTKPQVCVFRLGYADAAMPRKSCKKGKKMVVGDGFEPSKDVLADLQSAPFGRSGIPPSRRFGAGKGGRTPITSWEGWCTAVMPYPRFFGNSEFEFGKMVPTVGVEPTFREEHGPEPCASANSATSAHPAFRHNTKYSASGAILQIKSR